MIVSATYQEDPRRIDVRLDDGRLLTVPDDLGNRDRRKLAEWEAQGNTIAPYVAPPPLTADKRIDRIVSVGDDFRRLFFEVVFNHENRLRALEARPEVDRAQFRNALKSLLP